MAIDVDFRFVRAGIKISSLSTLLFAFSAQLAALAQSLFRRVRARPSPFPALLSPCLRALPTSSSLSATHNTGILAQPQPQSPFAPRINRSRHLASRLHRLIVLIAPAFENHELCTKSPDRALSNRAIVHKIQNLIPPPRQPIDASCATQIRSGYPDRTAAAAAQTVR